jgi:serine/threonine protein kinase
VSAETMPGVMVESAPPPPERAPDPTSVLHFRVLERLGEGGMGTVYKAFDTKLGRLVAVKRMAARVSGDASARERFRGEARAASALNHPSIVTVYSIEEVFGIDYIVMEYIEGEPLDRCIARGPLDLSLVIRLGADVADALEHAHRAGLVHRDVKPANVIVAASGSARVLDFGVAKAIASATAENPSSPPLTAAGTMVGTLPYMSPEQLAGVPLDGRADVFSLGCVLYEMATGVPAFTGRHPVELVQRLVALDPLPPSERVPGLPPAFDAVVMRALAKTPAARFATAGELAAALRALQTAR